MPPFGTAWERVHHRIHVYLENDWFYVRLTGPEGKELLKLNVSFHASDAHDHFYKDFLTYLQSNLYQVDRSSLPNKELECGYESLWSLILLCKSEPLQLSEGVVGELFKDVDAEIAMRDEEKRKLDKKMKRLLSQQERLAEELKATQCRRLELDGQHYEEEREEEDYDSS